MIFTNSKSAIPIDIPYNWHAEYVDGTSISEYDDEGKNRNDFYSIEQDKVIRFGLFSANKNFFFEANDGSFNLSGKRLEIEYHTKDGEVIRLTLNRGNKDLITYKQAYANFSKEGIQKSNIEAIAFGYKTILETASNKIFFKPVVSFSLETNERCMEIRLTAEKDMNGHVVFKRKGKEIERFEAPLVAGRTGQINWAIKL